MFQRGLLFFLLLFSVQFASAQVDSTVTVDPAVEAANVQRLDSLRWARKREIYRDSIRHVRDSIARLSDSLLLASVKALPPNSPNRFRDSIIQYYMIKNFDFNAWKSRFNRVSDYDSGIRRPQGELWSIIVVFGLLLLFAVLRKSFNNQLELLFQSFFSNRILGQISKEDDFFNTWPFVFLYLIFGFTLGMLLYELTGFYRLSYGYSGLNWYFRLSVIVIVFYGLKIFIVKILGFLFEVERIARDFVSVLFVTYFCLAILLMPVVIAFSLAPARFSPYYVFASVILLVGTYGIQFFRVVFNILSGYRFPKVYLILYLCALEISPLLILIKALRF